MPSGPICPQITHYQGGEGRIGGAVATLTGVTAFSEKVGNGFAFEAEGRREAHEFRSATRAQAAR